MGIIKNQAITSTAYIYIGIILGFANAAILLPNLLSTENVGLVSLIGSYTNIFSSIFCLGIPFLTIKIFPVFRNHLNNNHNGFFTFSLIASLIGIVMGSVSFYLLEDHIISGYNTAKEYKPFIYGFFILFTLRTFHKNFDAFIRMLHNTTLGAISENFILKGIIALSLFIYWYVDGYDFDIFFIIYLFALSFPGVLSIGYIIKNGLFKVSVTTFTSFAKVHYAQLWSLGSFGLIGAIGAIIILEIDKIMIGNMIGLSATGVYSTSFFFGLFVSVPSRGLKRIASVIMSDAWQNGDIELIKSVFYKSCINQFIMSLFLFLGIWLNIESIMQFLPEEYESGKFVILFIGLANVVTMLTGSSSEIIGSSKYYRFNTYFLSVMVVMVIILNYVFIPIWGITGAAWATTFSFVLVNASRYVFIVRKLKYQPLDSKIVLTLIVAIFCYFLIEFIIPTFSQSLYVNVLIKGSALTLIFWTAVYFLKLSEDINTVIDKSIKLIVSKVKDN